MTSEDGDYVDLTKEDHEHHQDFVAVDCETDELLNAQFQKKIILTPEQMIAKQKKREEEAAKAAMKDDL